MSPSHEPHLVGRWAVSRHRDGFYVEDRGSDLMPNPEDVVPVAVAMDDRFPEGVPPGTAEDGPEWDRVAVRVAAYTINALPEDHDAAHHFEIRVEYRGDGMWAVTRWRECLSADGTWDHEPLPSSRTDDWLAAHRFTEADAVRLAKQAAMAVRVNGSTAEDLLHGTRS